MLTLRSFKYINYTMKNLAKFSSAVNNSITTENLDGFNVMSFNRPPMSSFTLEVLDKLSKALDAAKAENCKGIIISSVSISFGNHD